MAQEARAARHQAADADAAFCMVERLVEKLLRKAPQLTEEQARRRVDAWIHQVRPADGFDVGTVEAAMQTAQVKAKQTQTRGREYFIDDRTDRHARALAFHSSPKSGSSGTPSAVCRS